MIVLPQLRRCGSSFLGVRPANWPLTQSAVTWADLLVWFCWEPIQAILVPFEREGLALRPSVRISFLLTLHVHFFVALEALISFLGIHFRDFFAQLLYRLCVDAGVARQRDADAGRFLNCPAQGIYREVRPAGLCVRRHEIRPP